MFFFPAQQGPFGGGGSFGLSTIGLSGRAKKGVVRERNRMHARKARLRKKIYLDSLKQSVEQLEEENARLRGDLSQYQQADVSRGRGSDSRGGCLRHSCAESALCPRSTYSMCLRTRRLRVYTGGV